MAAITVCCVIYNCLPICDKLPKGNRKATVEWVFIKINPSAIVLSDKLLIDDS